MSTGPLVIHHGSPRWWLSPDIWVTKPGGSNAPPGVGNPMAGTVYDVQVRVLNESSSVVSDWTLFVCWAIPTIGSIPLTAITVAQQLNNDGFTIAASKSQIFATEKKWTPSFVNGGHECLIALTYWNGLPFPFPSLDGDAGPNQSWSIAQHNLGVLPVPVHMRAPFHYVFQACNGADAERQFVITAQQAPLSEIEAFLPGLPGGTSVIENPGKVDGLGISGPGIPEAAEVGAVIAPHSCQTLTLSGVLETGNALIDVTQSLGGAVVGGLSVLVMAQGKPPE